MKGVLFHLLLLFFQIYLASKLASGSISNAGHLIKTKSGKNLLQLSSKKTKTKKDTKKSGNDYSNDGKANEKVTGKKGANVKVTGKKDAKEKATGKRGVNRQLPNYGQ